MIANVIFQLNDSNKITSLFVDGSSNSLFIGLSDGRIIKANRAIINAYATGNRAISAIVEDGYGILSGEAMLKVIYLCNNAILKLDDYGNVLTSWTVQSPFSANESQEIEGVFTSRPLWAGEDFIFWENVLWETSISSDAEVTIQIRVAETEGDLESKSWTSFSSISGIQSKSLDSFSKSGAWIQLRVLLKTINKNISPALINLAVSYRTKFSVYFFTTKFIMERGTNLKSGILTANMTMPQNTEIKIGITDTNSNEWDNYQIVDLDRAFLINNKDTERIKVGFKLTSISDSTFPTIDEFALMLGGEKMEIIRAS